MNHLRSFVAASALLVTLASAMHARADVLPPNDCTTGAGTPCNSAGPHFDQPGICTSETCQSGSGGSFACVLCEPVDAGPDAAADAAVDAAPKDAATSDAASADSGAEPTSFASSSSSCSVGAGPGAGASMLLGLGAIALLSTALVRRRKA